MSPELPQARLQLSLGPEIRLSKYLPPPGDSRVSREDAGCWLGSLPCLYWGSHRHVTVSFASAGPPGCTSFSSRLAVGGRGLLLAVARVLKPRVQATASTGVGVNLSKEGSGRLGKREP